MTVVVKRPGRGVTADAYDWLDQWKIAKSPTLKRLVEEVVREALAIEVRAGDRRRRRRPVDQKRCEDALEVLICNAVFAAIRRPSSNRVALTLGHGSKGRTRYDNPAFGKTTTALLDLLSEADVVDVCVCFHRGEASSLAPTAAFTQRVSQLGICVKDFGRHKDEEVVLLAFNKRSGWASKTGPKTTRELIPYRYETQTTLRTRKQLRLLNGSLAQAAIEFVGGYADGVVDVDQRTMRRHFLTRDRSDIRFDCGGRLFGGFWQTLRSDRRQHLRIDGEPVVDLDYSGMFTRLAFAQLGLPQPAGDPYTIKGFEGFRSGVKLAMNIFLFDGHRRRTWPDVMAVGIADGGSKRSGCEVEYQGRLPHGYDVRRTRAAILSAYPGLDQAWDCRLGDQLMFRESEIILSVLTTLAQMSVVALNMHDGLLVKRSAKPTAIDVMRSAARAAGVELPVVEKPIAHVHHVTQAA